MKRNLVENFVDCILKITYNFFGKISVTLFLVKIFDKQQKYNTAFHLFRFLKLQAVNSINTGTITPGKSPMFG